MNVQNFRLWHKHKLASVPFIGQLYHQVVTALGCTTERDLPTINQLKQAIVIVSGIAGLSGSSRSKADTLNIWCKNCSMWVTLDNN